MGPKSLRRLALAAVVLVLGVVSIFLLQRYQVSRMGQSNLDKAQVAEKSGDLAAAEDLYLQHITVFPEDDEAQLRFAKVLLERSKTLARMRQANQIYGDILTRHPGRDDVRRLRVNTLFDLNAESDPESRKDIRSNLTLLMRKTPDDGDLAYLMGRCQQAADEAEDAVKSYQTAVEKKATERFDAVQRMAGLYRDRLAKPEEGERVVNELVQKDPGDYRGYLERGRYHGRFAKTDEELAAVIADYQQASKLAGQEPGPYLELARLELQKSPPSIEAAVEVVQRGLKAAPKSGELHRLAGQLAVADGDPAAAVKAYRNGLEALPDNLDLRFELSELLARQGATVELREQIQALNRAGVEWAGDYFTAHALANAREWNAAKKVLLDKLIAPSIGLAPTMKANINTLLARCYGNLGDVDRQRSALAAAVRDNPSNMLAQVTWVDDLVARGDFDRAIVEYRKLVPTLSQIRPRLISLLVMRNQGVADSGVVWKEVDDLINQMEKDEPNSSEPVAFRAQKLMSQNLADDASAILEAARAKGYKDPNARKIWILSADLKNARRDFAGALKLLDQGQAELGDAADFRIARMKILAARNTGDLPADLIALTRGDETFPLEQRMQILESVAGELIKGDHTDEALEILNRFATIAPNDLRPQLQILNLALATPKDADQKRVARDRDAIVKTLADIRRIEGNEGHVGRFSEIQFLLWQSRLAEADADKQRIRQEARNLLTELRARRSDWSMLPLLTAQLEEQEFDQARDDADRKVRADRIANLYRQAIDMGQNGAFVLQTATSWFLKAGRSSEVAALWSKSPSFNGQSSHSYINERAVIDRIFTDNSPEDAEKIVRGRIADRPENFLERFLLAQILIRSRKIDEAEAVLREAVEADPADPDRRFILVQFLVNTGKLEEAEQAALQVEKAVSADRAPLAMANCASQVAMGCQAAAREADKTKWVATARSWFAKAQALKPQDFSIRRSYIEFLLRVNLVDDAEAELAAVIKSAGDPNTSFDPMDRAWAKRNLALTCLARSELTGDYQQALKALALYAPKGAEQDKLPDEVEDRRILARVFEAQRIPLYRRKAVEILEGLAADGRASNDDRFLLARLYNAGGKWDEAHAVYRELVSDVDPAKTAQDQITRVFQLSTYGSDLLEQVRVTQKPEEIAEARSVIERLKKIQPDGFSLLAMETRLDKAIGKIDDAAAKLKAISDRPNNPPALARPLAALAENLTLLDLAEDILKRNAAASAKLEDQLEYAAFLGRRDQVKRALDVCEPLWKATPNPAPIAPTVIAIVLSPKVTEDPTQIARVGGWLERSLQQNPKSPLLTIALGTLRDREQRYADAVRLYQQALTTDGGEVVPLNNLAWLLALQGEKGSAPLEMINRAISLRGPVPELLDTRAIVYLTVGDAQRAVNDLENAVAINPTAGHYFHLARAYLEAGNLEAARRTYASAQDKGLKESDVHPLERGALAQIEKALKK